MFEVKLQKGFFYKCVIAGYGVAWGFFLFDISVRICVIVYKAFTKGLL